MIGLVEYLRYAHKSFLNERNALSIINIVMGNSSGDMDSVVCTLGYSYLNFIKTGKIIYPIISFPQSELKLRRDIQYALNQTGLKPENELVFINDLNNDNKEYALTLVDHNNPDNEFWKTNENYKVVGIIDHHVDLEKFKDANPRIIQTSGSCSSLVWDYMKVEMKQCLPILSKSEIELLTAPLLLDTSNLERRVENIDKSSFTILSGDISTNTNTTTTKELFEKLSEEKNSTVGFSLRDILGKDYKEWDNIGNGEYKYKVGISSCTDSPNILIERYGNDKIEEELNQWIKDRKIDLLVVMSSFTDREGEFNRYINASGKLSGNVIKSVREELQLSEDNRINVNGGKWWKQWKTSASRKQVAPLIVSVIDAYYN